MVSLGMVDLESLIAEYLQVYDQNNLLRQQLSKGVEMQSALRNLIGAKNGEDKLQYALQNRPDKPVEPLPNGERPATMTDLVKGIIRSIIGNFTISDIISKVEAHGRKIDRGTTNIILWKLVGQGALIVVEKGKKGAEGIYRNKTL
jgi:hypothetical protein